MAGPLENQNGICGHTSGSTLYTLYLKLIKKISWFFKEAEAVSDMSIDSSDSRTILVQISVEF
jgi:hypothetical protein